MPLFVHHEHELDALRVHDTLPRTLAWPERAQRCDSSLKILGRSKRNRVDGPDHARAPSSTGYTPVNSSRLAPPARVRPVNGLDDACLPDCSSRACHRESTSRCSKASNEQCFKCVRLTFERWTQSWAKPDCPAPCQPQSAPVRFKRVRLSITRRAADARTRRHGTPRCPARGSPSGDWCAARSCFVRTEFNRPRSLVPRVTRAETPATERGRVVGCRMALVALRSGPSGASFSVKLSAGPENAVSGPKACLHSRARLRRCTPTELLRCSTLGTVSGGRGAGAGAGEECWCKRAMCSVQSSHGPSSR